MNDQDKRAVEGMARCGIDLEGLCTSFLKFPREEIENDFCYYSGVYRVLEYAGPGD